MSYLESGFLALGMMFLRFVRGVAGIRYSFPFIDKEAFPWMHLPYFVYPPLI